MANYNTHKTSTSLKFIVLIAICSLFISACTSGKSRSDEFRLKMAVRYLSYKLDLTDEQEKKAAAIGEEIKLIREETLAQREANKVELTRLLQSPQLDTVRLQQLLDQQLNSIKQNSPRVIPLIAKLHNSLTAEQREELIEMINRD